MIHLNVDIFQHVIEHVAHTGTLVSCTTVCKETKPCVTSILRNTQVRPCVVLPRKFHEREQVLAKIVTILELGMSLMFIMPFRTGTNAPLTEDIHVQRDINFLMDMVEKSHSTLVGIMIVDSVSGIAPRGQYLVHLTREERQILSRNCIYKSK